MPVSADLSKKAQNKLYKNMTFMNEVGYYGKESLAESHVVSEPFETTQGVTREY